MDNQRNSLVDRVSAAIARSRDRISPGGQRPVQVMPKPVLRPAPMRDALPPAQMQSPGLRGLRSKFKKSPPPAQ